MADELDEEGTSSSISISWICWTGRARTGTKMWNTSSLVRQLSDNAEIFAMGESQMMLFCGLTHELHTRGSPTVGLPAYPSRTRAETEL